MKDNNGKIANIDIKVGEATISNAQLIDFIIIGLESNNKTLFSCGYSEDKELVKLFIAYALSHFKQAWKINDNEFTLMVSKIKNEALHIEHHDIENKLKQLFKNSPNQENQAYQEHKPNE